MMNMRLLIIFFVFFISSTSCLSQNISSKVNIEDGVLYLIAPQFHEILINNVSLEKLIYSSNSWELIEDKMGDPNEVIDDSTILSNEKIIRYDGAEFMYTDIPDSLSLTNITLKGERFSLNLGNNSLTPGMPFQQLKMVLPEEYKLGEADKITIRIAVTDNSGNTRRDKSGNILYSDIDKITIWLNNATKTVSRIEVNRIYT